MKIKNKTTGLFSLAALSLFTLCIMGVMAIGQADAETKLSKGQIAAGQQVNEEGLTYGPDPSVAYCEDMDTVEIYPDGSTELIPSQKSRTSQKNTNHLESVPSPDLLLVEATNGKLGYINVKEADEQVLGISLDASQEEIDSWAVEAREKQIIAVKEAATEVFGSDILTKQQAERINSALDGINGEQEIMKELQVGLQQSKNKTTKNQKISEDSVLELSEIAAKKLSTVVPVYESDGKTVIGEFVVYGM